MARKRKLSQSSDDFIASDSDDEAYEPKTAAGSSRKASTKITSRKKRASPKQNSSKKARKTKSEVEDVSGDEEDFLEGQTIPHSASLHTVTSAKAIRAALLAWYDVVHEVRGMPWRKPFDHAWNEEERAQRAYEVWISEIMLQQTQVVTVIPYYTKWMAKFPTIRHLAQSDIDTVNALWKGLGYYSRAARILQGAQKAVKELGGSLPDNAKDMESQIPGIGRYSAGAICSIAYNQCVPLDGNVHRLLSRFLALHTPPKAKQGLDVLWEAAAAVVKGSDRPGDVNQALIELGATVCKPHDPLCHSCPIQTSCQAYARQESDGKVDPDAPAPSSETQLRDIEDLCTLCRPLPIPTLVTVYPMKVERKKAREELDVVSVIEWRPSMESNDRWFLLVRRPEGGLLAGLHEFPTISNVTVKSAEDMATFAQSAMHQLLVSPPQPRPQLSSSPPARKADRGLYSRTASTEDDLRIAKTKPAGDVLHIFSHIRKTYRIQWVLLVGGCGGAVSSNGPSKQGSKAMVDAGADSGSEDPPPSPPLPPTLHSSLPPFAGRLAPNARAPAKSKRATPSTTKRKKVIAADNVDDTESTRLEAMWVRMDDVPDANIGTGVLKVWKQVCTLWGS